MVQFNTLVNEKKNRKVREVIENGDDSIFVYEPTKEDMSKIIEMQEMMMMAVGGDGDSINISGVELIKGIFPLLTNIEGLSELSDDEVVHIVENPTIALIQTQHVVEIIVTQVYKTVILSAKKQVLDVDFEIGSMNMAEDVIGKSLIAAGKDSAEASEIVGRINQDYEALVEAEEKEAVDRENSGNAAVTVLADYKKTFAETTED